MSNLSLIELRKTIQIILEDYLGTFSNKQPAIWVEPPFRPAGKIEGIACIISATPEQISVKAATGNLKAITESYVITLVQFDRSQNIVQPMRQIQKILPIIATQHIPPTDKFYEQVIMRVKNTGFI
jgi:hypothetical protein